MRPTNNQEVVDRFYADRGPCCAGCDWWHHIDSLVGECHKSAPVSGEERTSMLGLSSWSLPLESGHVMTRRDHHCGAFADTFDWSTLPADYLRRIGAKDRLGLSLVRTETTERP